MKQSKMRKILILNDQDEKELIEVDATTGEYSVKDRILWDEKEKGAISEDILKEFEEKEESERKKRSEKAFDLDVAMDKLKKIDFKNDLSAKEINQALRLIVKILTK